MTRPKLLLLSHTLPFPPHQGVEIRALQTLRLLSTVFDVTALCFHRFASEAEVESALSELTAYGNIRAFRIPQAGEPARWLWDHVRSIATRRVYTEFLYQSPEFEAALDRELAQGNFDLAHFESVVDLASYLPRLGRLPVAGTHHNVETALLRRRAAIEGHAGRRAYLRFQAGLMDAVERAACAHLKLNVAVSEGDRRLLLEREPRARYLVVPNGVDTEKFRPQHAEQDGIVFVGGSTWFPNRDALDFFSREILPLIRARVPNVPVRWVGKSTDSDQLRYHDEAGIELTGTVDDIRPFVHQAACFVVPLRVGGGTRLKILDGWAMGKAIVSTTIGCEGLEARHEGNILIADTPQSFAEAVLRVLGDRTLRDRLGENGRATAEALYGWDIVGAPMLRAYLALAQGRGTGDSES